MENFSIIADRKDLENLGWGYDGWGECEPGEYPGFDFVRIDNQDGKLSWVPCEENGKILLGATSQATGDDAKTLEDVRTLGEMAAKLERLTCWKFRGGYSYSSTHGWRSGCALHLWEEPTDWKTAKNAISEGGLEGFGLSDHEPRIYKTLSNDWQGPIWSLVMYWPKIGSRRLECSRITKSLLTNRLSLRLKTPFNIWTGFFFAPDSRIKKKH
jgi:hypothetical protein